MTAWSLISPPRAPSSPRPLHLQPLSITTIALIAAGQGHHPSQDGRLHPPARRRTTRTSATRCLLRSPHSQPARPLETRTPRRDRSGPHRRRSSVACQTEGREWAAGARACSSRNSKSSASSLLFRHQTYPTFCGPNLARRPWFGLCGCSALCVVVGLAVKTGRSKGQGSAAPWVAAARSPRASTRSASD